MMTTTVGGQIWVCEDCMLVDANGEENDNRPDSEPETWALWPDSADIAMGGDHEDGCTAWDDGTDCECETRGFSWSRCDGCGSFLGGARYAFTWFENA